MLGGHSQQIVPDAEMLEFFLGLRYAIELKACRYYETFEVVGYTQQVVAGMIYRLQIRVAAADHEHVWV